MEVLSLVHELALPKGSGIVVVLHGINMAARFCDQIIALHSGRVIARGAPADILVAPSGGYPIAFLR